MEKPIPQNNPEVFALRNLFEQVSADKVALQGQVQQQQALLAAVLLSITSEELLVTSETLDLVVSGEVDGISIEPNPAEEGGLVLTLVRATL